MAADGVIPGRTRPRRGVWSDATHAAHTGGALHGTRVDAPADAVTVRRTRWRTCRQWVAPARGVVLPAPDPGLEVVRELRRTQKNARFGKPSTGREAESRALLPRRTAAIVVRLPCGAASRARFFCVASCSPRPPGPGQARGRRLRAWLPPTGAVAISSAAPLRASAGALLAACRAPQCERHESHQQHRPFRPRRPEDPARPSGVRRPGLARLPAHSVKMLVALEAETGPIMAQTAPVR